MVFGMEGARPAVWKAKMTRRKTITRLISLILAAALISLIIYVTGWENIHSLRIVNPLALILAVLTFACVVLTTSIRWRRLVCHFTGRPTASVGFYYGCMITMRFLGLISTQSVGDLVIRPLFLWKGDEASIERALVSSIVDKCFDMAFATFFLAVAAVVAFELQLAGIVAAAVVGGVCLAFIFRMNVLVRIGRKAILKSVGALAKLLQSGTNLHNWFIRIRDKLADAKEIPPLPFTEAAIGMGLTALRVALLATHFWLVTIACGLDFPFHIILLSLPVAQFAGSIPLTPGALGVTDIGWVGVLMALGRTRAEGGTFALVARVVMSLSIILLAGIVNLAFPQYRQMLFKKRNEDQGNPDSPQD